MNPLLAEFIGTTILVIFGNGVVANVVLSKTKGNNGAGSSSAQVGAWQCSSESSAPNPSAVRI
jgi:glycerol uptake facilitator-like aquaporin